MTFDKPCVSTMGHRENIFGVPLVPLPNAPSAGQSLVTILGANFGRLDSSPAARLGASSSSSTLWLLDDRLICRSPPGVGQAFAVVASVSYAVGGTLSASWSYDRPALDEMSQYNIPSPASASSPEKEVIIIGDNFGSCVYSEDSRVGGSASLRTQWISNTIIASKVAQGVGQAMTIVASVAGLQGSSLPVLSFDQVSTTAILRSGVGVVQNLASSSDAWLLLSGDGFGRHDYSASVRIGGTCAETTIWKSATEIITRHAAGASQELAFVVTLAQASMSQRTLLSFDVPSITAVHAHNAPAKGEHVVEFFGSAFGSSDWSVGARLGHTACMRSAWMSDSSVSCKVPAGSAQENAALQLTVKTSSSNTVASPSATFSYNTAPIVDGIHPNVASSQGGSILTVVGQRMSISPSLEIQLWRRGGRNGGGLRMFAKICHVSHALDPLCHEGVLAQTQIGTLTNITLLVPPGVGDDMMVVYRDASAGLPVFESWHPTFSYAPPCISSVIANGRKANVTVGLDGSRSLDTPHLLSASGGQRLITIVGSSFGGAEGNLLVTVGDSGSSETSDNVKDLLSLELLKTARHPGLLGHTTCVLRVPDIDETLLAGGLLKRSIQLVLQHTELEDRVSQPVTKAISFTSSSLPLLLTLDADYDAIRSSPAATASFVNSFQAMIIRLLLPGAGNAVDRDISESQRQQVSVRNISRGSTLVSFKVLDSADGSWAPSSSVHLTLLTAYKTGELAAAVAAANLGNLTLFQAQGYTPTTTTTTPAPTTTPVATTPSPTPEPSKSWAEENAVPLTAAGAGMGALILFSGLVMLIRRSLSSEEDLIKNAFSSLARQPSRALTAQESWALMASQHGAAVSNHMVTGAVQEQLMITAGPEAEETLSHSRVSTDNLDTSTQIAQGFVMSPAQAGLPSVFPLSPQEGRAATTGQEAQEMTPAVPWEPTSSGTVQSLTGAMGQAALIRSHLTGGNASAHHSPFNQAADRMEQGGSSHDGSVASNYRPKAGEPHADEGKGSSRAGLGGVRWNVPTPGQVRSWLMPDSSPKMGSAASAGERVPALGERSQMPALSMSSRKVVTPADSGSGGVTRQAAQVSSRVSSRANAAQPQARTQVPDPNLTPDVQARPQMMLEEDDEPYFSASDPESFLMHRFENLDEDAMDVASQGSSAFSALKTLSQTTPGAGAGARRSRRTRSRSSNHGNHSGVRSQRVTPLAVDSWTGPAPPASDSDFSLAAAGAHSPAARAARETRPPLAPTQSSSAVAPSPSLALDSRGNLPNWYCPLLVPMPILSYTHTQNMLGVRSFSRLDRSPAPGRAAASEEATAGAPPAASWSSADPGQQTGPSAQEVVIPRQWQAASSNRVQRQEFAGKPESDSGPVVTDSDSGHDLATLDQVSIGQPPQSGIRPASAQVLSDDSDAVDESIATLGKSAVYVSLAPVSRAHNSAPIADPADDDSIATLAPIPSPSPPPRTVAGKVRTFDDESWINTPARHGRKAPQNTPIREQDNAGVPEGDADPAAVTPPVSLTSLTYRTQELSNLSADESEETTVLQLLMSFLHDLAQADSI